MRHASIALLLCLALAGTAAGCGGDDKSSSSSKTNTATTAGNKYPSEVRENFISSCTKAGNADRKTCECALDKVEKTVSFEDFKAADEQIRKDPQAKPPVYQKLIKAARDCVSKS